MISDDASFWLETAASPAVANIVYGMVAGVMFGLAMLALWLLIRWFREWALLGMVVFGAACLLIRLHRRRVQRRYALVLEDSAVVESTVYGEHKIDIVCLPNGQYGFQEYLRVDGGWTKRNSAPLVAPTPEEARALARDRLWWLRQPQSSGPGAE